MVAEQAWEAAEAQSCGGDQRESPVVSAEDAPSLKDIEELVCEVASMGDVEDRAVGAVCDKIVEQFPKLKLEDQECKTLLEGVWDAAIAKCPPRAVQKVGKGIPPHIKDIVCMFVGGKTLEDEATDAVCQEVKKMFPELKMDPDCKTVVEDLWEAGYELFCMNAESEDFAVAADLVPPFVGGMICDILQNKTIEK